MKRRQLLIAIGAGSLFGSLPRLTIAQKGPTRIGFLATRSKPTVWNADYYGAFLRGMQDLHYTEGKDFAMEWRFADGDSARLPELANELVKSKVDIIVTGGTQAIRAASEATKVIPIVMGNSNDPVGEGLIASLARPGGNITGLANTNTGLSPTHMSLMQEVVPGLSRVAVLLNPKNQNYTPILKSMYDAAAKMRLKIIRLEAKSPREIDGAFAAMDRAEAQAVITAFDALYVQQRHQIGALALKYRLPSLFPVRQQVEAGGLMSYGQNYGKLYRRASVYVDKILKGASPADLPVEQATKFELVINNRIARALALEIPSSVRQRADKFIG